MVTYALPQSQDDGSIELSTEAQFDQLNSTSGDFSIIDDEDTSEESSSALPTMDSSESPLSSLTKRVRRAAEELSSVPSNELAQTAQNVPAYGNDLSTPASGPSYDSNPSTMASSVADLSNSSSQVPVDRPYNDVHYGVIDDGNSSDSKPGEFTCNDRKFGYYADEGRNCSYYHLCIPVRLPIFQQRTYYQRLSFICADNTWFDQTQIKCVPHPTIACSDSAKYYEHSAQLLLANGTSSTEPSTYDVSSPSMGGQ
jgi:hypothetical protein